VRALQECKRADKMLAKTIKRYYKSNGTA